MLVSPGRVGAKRAGSVLIGLLIVAAMVAVIKHLAAGAKGSHQQVAKITIIDTPPPPPPPPPKEPPKEQPKEQPKEMKIEQPKPVEAPPQQAEQLKMEGAAGDGPSAFGAGPITNDYTGQQLGGGVSGGIGGLEFSSYLNRLQRLLQDELIRNKELKQSDYHVTVSVHLNAEGKVRSVELPVSSGDATADDILKRELQRLLQSEPPPASAPQGGFIVRVTNKIIN